MNKTPAYYRKRIKVLENLVEDNKKKTRKTDENTSKGKKLEKEKRLLINGSIPKNYNETALIKNSTERKSNEPLSLPELTRYNTYFEMHPEKVAGEEYITTSRSFPILVKGTKEDVIDTIKNENDKNLSGVKNNHFIIEEIINTIIEGDVLEQLKKIPDESIDCMITSPPYWQLRDYGWKGQWGLEPTVDEYLLRLWAFMDEIKRVLKPKGTVWMNLGDTYGTQSGTGKGKVYKSKSTKRHVGNGSMLLKGKAPHKSQLLIPHRFAIGCMERGWIIRNDIIWAKTNGMPESVKDRFAKKHEYIFFMTKSPDYYFDLDSVREHYKESSKARAKYAMTAYGGDPQNKKGAFGKGRKNGASLKKIGLNPKGKNPGSVSDFWDIATKGTSDKHYAAYNTELITKPILAGCPKGGIVLDPFCGTGITGVKSLELGRKFIGIEGKKEYCKIARKNIEAHKTNSLGMTATEKNITAKTVKEHPSTNSGQVQEEIKFLKQYLSLHGKIKTKEQLLHIIQELQRAIKEQRIRKTSPYAKEIEHIQQQLLKAYHATNNQLKIQLAPETIKKFNALLKQQKGLGILPLVASAAVAAVTSRVVNKIFDGIGSVVSSEELANMKFEKIGFKGKWKEFIGDPCPGFTAMIFGKPKMGKSYFAVEFAGYLARNHGKVLYVAKEEGLDATFQLKLKDKNVAHPDLFVSSYLPENLSPYNFVILDSVNKLRLSPEDLEKLKKNNPTISFIYIFQTTKEGNFRGSNHFQHDVDVVIEIPEKGRAIQNGRFNQGGEMDIFDEKTPETKDFKVSEKNAMLAGINKKNMKTENKKSTKTKAGNKKTEEKLKKFDDGNDELNPRYLFCVTPTMLLIEILKGEFDLNYLIRKELADRGVDKDGKWIGFDKAEKLYRV